MDDKRDPNDRTVTSSDEASKKTINGEPEVSAEPGNGNAAPTPLTGEPVAPDAHAEGEPVVPDAHAEGEPVAPDANAEGKPAPDGIVEGPEEAAAPVNSNADPIEIRVNPEDVKKIEIKAPEEVRKQANDMRSLDAAQIKAILDTYNTPDADGKVEFNDPILGLKFAARYKALTGEDHKGFKVEADKVISDILSNKDGVESQEPIDFRNLEEIQAALNGRDNAREIVYSFPGQTAGWDYQNPQLMKQDALETLLSVAGRNLIVAGSDKMFFSGTTDPIRIARANQIYKERTGHDHPRYTEMLPEIAEVSREILTNEGRAGKRTVSQLKMLTAIVDSYDLEEVDLGKALFTEEERSGMELYENRKSKPLPKEEKDVRAMLADPSTASFEELKIVLDHLKEKGPFKFGDLEVSINLSVENIYMLNKAYQSFTGGKSHSDYLKVMPDLLKQEIQAAKDAKKPRQRTDEEQKRFELLEKMDKELKDELQGERPSSESKEKFEYTSHEKTATQRMALTFKDKSSPEIAEDLNKLLLESKKRAITSEEFTLMTQMHAALVERNENINPEVALFIQRATNAMNEKRYEQPVLPKEEKEEKGTSITAGGAAVLVTADTFGKIGRGVIRLLKKGGQKIAQMFKKNKEKTATRTETVVKDFAVNPKDFAQGPNDGKATPTPAQPAKKPKDNEGPDR